jgi:RNA polymerase sigma factor (sigma-70 family)
MTQRPEPSGPRVADRSEPGEPDFDSLTNTDLVLIAQREPVRGVALMHRRFSAEVNRLVWRLLGADPDHNDLVQQVFVKVLTNSHRLREPERLGAWVQSITVNTVYEELRKREVRRIFLREWREPAIYPNLVHDVEVRDFLVQSKAIIEKLPAKERVVFMLHFVEGRTLAEVAELMDYSLATAKRRLAAANKRFESLLGNNADLRRLLEERKLRLENGAGAAAEEEGA